MSCAEKRCFVKGTDVLHYLVFGFLNHSSAPNSNNSTFPLRRRGWREREGLRPVSDSMAVSSREHASTASLARLLEVEIRTFLHRILGICPECDRTFQGKPIGVARYRYLFKHHVSWSKSDFERTKGMAEGRTRSS